MARERMVTRTVTTHDVEFKLFNLDSMQLEVKVLSFGVDTLIENNDKGLAILNARLTKDGVNGKAVMIDKITDNEVLYGMPEVDFLKYAKVLPPRTTTE